MFISSIIPTSTYNPLAISDMADETERSPLLRHDGGNQTAQLAESSSSMNKDPETTAEEIKMADTAVGERLKYNDYTTIDWLHDLVNHYTYGTVSIVLENCTHACM